MSQWTLCGHTQVRITKKCPLKPVDLTHRCKPVLKQCKSHIHLGKQATGPISHLPEFIKIAVYIKYYLGFNHHESYPVNLLLTFLVLPHIKLLQCKESRIRPNNSLTSLASHHKHKSDTRKNKEPVWQDTTMPSQVSQVIIILN